VHERTIVERHLDAGISVHQTAHAACVLLPVL
jgi:hypothetical protein